MFKAVVFAKGTDKTVAYAIGKVHIEAVHSSLSAGIGDPPPDTLTALMSAALIGHTPALIALLDRGVDINSQDLHGRTALMEAVYGGHMDTVKTLLERGADANIVDDSGWTALMEAASKGFYEAVALLLGRNADPNARTHSGWTALKATARGNFAITRLLKEAGAR